MKTCNWTQKPIWPPLRTGCLESVSSSCSTIINLGGAGPTYSFRPSVFTLFLVRFVLLSLIFLCSILLTIGSLFVFFFCCHCIVCPTIYDFWLSPWYCQKFSGNSQVCVNKYKLNIYLVKDNPLQNKWECIVVRTKS
jgi:hypothetical protein